MRMLLFVYLTNIVLAGEESSKNAEISKERARRGRVLFVQGYTVRGEIDAAETLAGLGPLFNLDSCAGCHHHPTVGGGGSAFNPQYAFAESLPVVVRKLLVPQYVPARQFRSQKTGALVPLFAVSDASTACLRSRHSCMAEGKDCDDLMFRIPIPLFGTGSIDAIPDSEIIRNARSNSSLKRRFGIRGAPNMDRQGRVGKFGWKSGTSTLHAFVMDALLFEMGITMGTSTGLSGSCSSSDAWSEIDQQGNRAVDDLVSFVASLRPVERERAQASGSKDIDRGEKLFQRIGCALCHIPTLHTSVHDAPSASSTAHLYSDLLLHRMGIGLADGISEGSATGRDFRTAPLWGLRYRKFLLHDGRAMDIHSAIVAHASSGDRDSEAYQTVAAYEKLSVAEARLLLVFLNSL